MKTCATPVARASGANKMYNLRCSDGDGVSFEVASSGIPTSGFQERRRYRLELEHGTPCVLVIDDVVVDCMLDGGRQRWEWQPQFFAGTVLAELLDLQGTRLASYRLDVTPAPDKLGQVLFDQIINDLLAADPQLLFGAEAAQSAIGAEGEYTNPYLEYGRIKTFLPLLLQSIRQLCVRPLTRLHSHRELVLPHRVRRFDQHSVRSMARKPQMLAALRGVDAAPTTPASLVFNVPISREEFDTPAHRTLLAMLRAIIMRVRKVRADLEHDSAGEKATVFRTPTAPRLNYRVKLLGELEQALHRQCRSAPFTSVRRAEVSAAGLNVIAGNPLYAITYRHGWQILRSGTGGPQSGEMLAISPTWEIYERWCFLRVTDSLRTLFPALSWQRLRSRDHADRLRYIGTADGITVTAYLQKTFPAMDKKAETAAHYSISRKRRPDIVVTCTRADRERFIVFDPKYCVARSSVLAAMEAAHIYSDCLRWNGRAPDLTLLLIPSTSEAAWLEEPAFHAEHSVGALPLSPGIGLEELRIVLQQLLLET